MSKKTYVGFLIFCSSFLVSCDPTYFDSFQNTGYDYSIIGYFDVARETQFISVEPFRDFLLIGTKKDLSINLTLTDLDSGKVALLKDSLFNIETVGIEKLVALTASYYFPNLNPDEEGDIVVQEFLEMELLMYGFGRNSLVPFSHVRR